MVLNKIPPEYELRPILEALLEELSARVPGGSPALDPFKVEQIIEKGKPKRT